MASIDRQAIFSGTKEAADGLAHVLAHAAELRDDLAHRREPRLRLLRQAAADRTLQLRRYALVEPFTRTASFGCGNVNDSFAAGVGSSDSVKLPAGSLVLYPSTSLHSVRAVTSGARVASFFWIQSMVRDDGQRTLLFDLDTAIQRLNQDAPDHPSAVQLTGVYHNLLRRWAEL